MNALKPIEDLRNTIQRLEGEFEKALPPQIPVQKFIRVVMTAIQSNADLSSAIRASLFEACMKCASDGLLPDGREAAFVIFKSKAGPKVVYMPMYQGLLKKVRNSGELLFVDSQLVYEHDKFDYWTDDLGPHITHKPLPFGDRGMKIGAYSMAKTKDGGIYIAVMSANQILDVKNTSKAKDFGPWSGPFEDEMWRKTVLRRLCKYLPLSTDIDDFDRHQDDENQDQTIPEPASTSSRLAKLMAEGKSVTINEPDFDQDNWKDKDEVP